jgi:hypothetical protein
MVDSKKRQHPFESNLSDAPGIRLVPKEPGQHSSDNKAPRSINVNNVRNKKSVVKRLIEYFES